MLPSRREGAHSRLHASRSTHNNTSTHVSWRFSILHTQPELGGLEARSSSSTEPGLGIARYPGGLMSVTFVLSTKTTRGGRGPLGSGSAPALPTARTPCDRSRSAVRSARDETSRGMRVANKYHTLTAETRRRWASVRLACATPVLGGVLGGTVCSTASATVCVYGCCYA